MQPEFTDLWYFKLCHLSIILVWCISKVYIIMVQVKKFDVVAKTQFLLFMYTVQLGPFNRRQWHALWVVTKIKKFERLKNLISPFDYNFLLFISCSLLLVQHKPIWNLSWTIWKQYCRGKININYKISERECSRKIKRVIGWCRIKFDIDR